MKQARGAMCILGFRVYFEDGESTVVVEKTCNNVAGGLWLALLRRGIICTVVKLSCFL